MKKWIWIGGGVIGMVVVLLILFIVALQFLARVYVYSVAYTVATVASTLNEEENPQRMRISVRFREDNPNGKCTKCKSWIAPLGCGCIVIDF